MTTKKTNTIVGDADEQKRVADIGYGGIDIKMGDSEGRSGDIEVAELKIACQESGLATGHIWEEGGFGEETAR